MGRILVAVVTLLLAASPALAQESETESTAAEEGAEGSSQACRVFEFHVLDPNTPYSHWVIADPDGCFREFIRKTIRELPPV